MAASVDRRAAAGAPLGAGLGAGGGSWDFDVARGRGSGLTTFLASGELTVAVPLFGLEGPTPPPQIGHLESFPGCQPEDQKTSPQEQAAGVIFVFTASSGGTASAVPHAGQLASRPASRSRTQKSPPQEQLIEIMAALI